MTAAAPSSNPTMQLLQYRGHLALHQAIAAIAQFGVADFIERGIHSTTDLARELSLNEDALYRTLRALAGQAIFEETAPRSFRNTPLSTPLRSDVPGSVRALFIFSGSEFVARPFQEIAYSIQTGIASRHMLSGMGSFEYLAQNPELAKIFDDAMTSFSNLIGPSVAAAYDFSAWESLTDVAGGNGILRAHILKAHKNLRGVLADVPHVLDRARERGFLSGDIAPRAKMLPCNFFEEIPSGTRAYLMKSIIHDWDDDQALLILRNCRRSIPSGGALLLVELGLSEPNQPSTGKIIDLYMLVLTGGKERTTDEYRALLARAGFRLDRVVPTSSDFVIFEALPA
ncbi:MAG: methyltransferase [Candidatus Acidiferrum sp.]